MPYTISASFGPALRYIRAITPRSKINARTDSPEIKIISFVIGFPVPSTRKQFVEVRSHHMPVTTTVIRPPESLRCRVPHPRDVFVFVARVGSPLTYLAPFFLRGNILA